MLDYPTIYICSFFLALIFGLQLLVTIFLIRKHHLGIGLFTASFLNLACLQILTLFIDDKIDIPSLRSLYLLLVGTIFFLYLLGWHRYFGDSLSPVVRITIPLLLLLSTITFFTDILVFFILLNIINNGFLIWLLVYMISKALKRHPFFLKTILFLNVLAIFLSFFLFITDMSIGETRLSIILLDYAEALNIPLQFSIFMISITLGIMKRRREIDRKLLRETEKLAGELEQLVITDPLTGINNRRGFERVLGYEFEQLKRGSGAYALMLGDIDLFKRVNDRWGHDCGDMVIRTAVQTISDNIRSQDTLARWGGEEFIVLLNGGSPGEYRAVAERIRHSIEESRPEFQGEKIDFTMSFGLSSARPEDSDGEMAVTRADIMLYKAKKKGRNRVILFEDPASEG